jgi:phosphoglycolate phosphatase-like HAD superfamily hydrolase
MTDLTPPFGPDDLDAVLFDMDGTLIETDDAQVRVWARRAARVTRSPERAERIARRVVMAMESPANAFFTALDLVGLDAFVLRLLIALNGGTGVARRIPPVVGADELARALSARYRLGIVSTRRAAESAAALDALGIAGCFGVIAGRDTTWRIKPHAAPVLYAARTLGVDPARCLMVGDTTVDVIAGRRAGAWTCGVLCGFGERAELERAGADLILDHTALLADVLLP